MNNKKIRLIIAVVVAILAHIIASLFFLLLGTHKNITPIKTFTEIEVYNATEQTPFNSDESNTTSTASPKSEASNSIADISELQPSIEPISTVAPTVHNTVSSDVQSNSQSRQSTTAATGNKSGAGSGSSSRAGVPVTMPRVLTSIQPVYPLQAKNNGIQGRVYLRILVNTQGLVENVNIAVSSGNDSLDDAAKQAALSWRFSPAKDERGQLVNCYIRMPIDFNLKNQLQ